VGRRNNSALSAQNVPEGGGGDGSQGKYSFFLGEGSLKEREIPRRKKGEPHDRHRGGKLFHFFPVERKRKDLIREEDISRNGRKIYIYPGVVRPWERETGQCPTKEVGMGK